MFTEISDQKVLEKTTLAICGENLGVTNSKVGLSIYRKSVHMAISPVHQTNQDQPYS
jgi:hypothetical protein